MPSRICVCVKGESTELLLERARAASSQSSLIELRLDGVADLNLTAVAAFIAAFPGDLILTQRDEELTDSQIENLAFLQPTYIDLDISLGRERIQDFIKKHPEVGYIVSAHVQARAISATIKALQETRAPIIKIAVSEASALEILQAYDFSALNSQKYIIAASGEASLLARVLAPMKDSPWTYAALQEGLELVPSQPTLQHLENRYRFSCRSSQTQLLGLMGEQVSGSYGMGFHNRWLIEQEIDALYLPLPLDAADVPSFLQKAQEWPFAGMSVTMPLKQEVVSYCSELSEVASLGGAVNTLIRTDSGFRGENTDGQGVWQNLLFRFPDRKKLKVVILGGGGAARGVWAEGHMNGNQCTFVVRRPESLSDLKEKGADIRAWSELPEIMATGPDVLINCTPVGMMGNGEEIPIDPDLLQEGMTVVDMVSRPARTRLIAEAYQRGCSCMSGLLPFYVQARIQQSLWKPILEGVSCQQM